MSVIPDKATCPFPAFAPVQNFAIEPESAPAPKQAGPEHMAEFAELLHIYRSRNVIP